MQLTNQTKLMKKMMKIWKNNQRIALIITAAGSSTRFGKNIKKEYLPVVENDPSKGTVLGRSLETFLETGYFSTIVIIIPENQQREAEKALSYLPLGKSLLNKEIDSINFSFCTGGNTRQSSVFEGLKCVQKLSGENTPDAVLIHDGARPFVSKKIIDDVINCLEKSAAAVPGVPAVDTQKQVDESGKIVAHLQRSTIYAVQTPQAFQFEKLLEAHKKASIDGRVYTDDTEIWGQYCGDVYISYGETTNKKITYKEDLITGSRQ